jgi:serine/threonine protein kinase
VADGVAYLHGCGFIHGDIKSVSWPSPYTNCFLFIRLRQKNILINDEGKACITDFGLTRELEVPDFTTELVEGSTRWMAKELLSWEYDGVPQLITEASDTWAFGMTVLEVRLSIDTRRQPR